MTSLENVGKYIAERRKAAGLTQSDLGRLLNVSMQAISKWENGICYPGVEILMRLAAELGVTVDEILSGRNNSVQIITFKDAGLRTNENWDLLNKSYTYVSWQDENLIDTATPFASMYRLPIKDMEEPVLSFMVNSPGSKLRFAIDYGYVKNICHDLVNKLANDIVQTGAKPYILRNAVVCGNLNKEILETICMGFKEACETSGIAYAGSEISFQPRNVAFGDFTMTAGMAGLVDRKNILDGKNICDGDIMIALPSRGMHSTNFPLLRILFDKCSDLKNVMMDNGRKIVDEIMEPGYSYYEMLEKLLNIGMIKGIVIPASTLDSGCKYRMVPDKFDIEIYWDKLKPTELFRKLYEVSNMYGMSMPDYFNCGIGMIIIIDKRDKEKVMRHLHRYINCYEMGRIKKGDKKEAFLEESKETERCNGCARNCYGKGIHRG